jgi:hypothetical protein
MAEVLRTVECDERPEGEAKEGEAAARRRGRAVFKSAERVLCQDRLSLKKLPGTNISIPCGPCQVRK